MQLWSQRLTGTRASHGGGEVNFHQTFMKRETDIINLPSQALYH